MSTRPAIPFADLEKPRVVIVALAGIGNLLMQSPLWVSLKHANPSAEIAVLVAPRGTAELLRQNPRVTRILRGSAKPSPRAWVGMVRAIREIRPHIGIVAFPGQLVTSSSVLKFGRARARIGHRYTYRFLTRTGLFLTHAVPEAPVHDVEQNLRLLAPLGVAADPADARYDFPLASDDRAVADAFLSERRLDEHPRIGIHPGAHTDLPYKRWPADRWSRLADHLADRYGARILVFGGPDEQPLKQQVADALRAPAVIVDLPIRTTAAVIARCGLFVSNDSGLMHVAVSVDVETFGLFGPTDERRTAPWGPRGHVIRAKGTDAAYDVARLAAVRSLQKPHPSLLALSVEEVLDAVTARVPAMPAP